MRQQQRPRSMDHLEWIMDHSRRITDSGCWEWTRGTTNGYGSIAVDRRMVRVHRYVWLRMVGEIPDGFVVDHECRNPLCFNPVHLRATTQAVNAIENSDSPVALNAQKTHCPKGHPYEPGNLYPKVTYRRCWTCKVAADRALSEKRRLASGGAPRGPYKTKRSVAL